MCFLAVLAFFHQQMATNTSFESSRRLFIVNNFSAFFVV